MPIVAIVVVTTITILVAWCCWKAEHRVLGNRVSFRAVVSLMLLAIGLWTPLLILVSSQLQLPGSYGPVQFWAGEDESYLIMFYARIVSMFTIMFGLMLLLLTVVATIAECIKSAGRTLKLIALPFVSILAYGICCWSASYFYFYPSV